MPTLAAAIAEVRSRIARYQGKRRINEENTKATLIEPIIRALGWDIEDIEEVNREFKVKRRDRPVDYALLANRNPRLFIEAKALSENLSDRRWMNQIRGYAAVAGVEWIALTDGNEYRLYNSHATVAVDEKLFRRFTISDDEQLALDTLALLNKRQLEDNRIDVLWRAQFVDRQVQAALEELFEGDSDMLLVNYVKSRAKNVPVEDIRSSLVRCRARFDFPPPGTDDLIVDPKLPGHRVTLSELVGTGALVPPLDLEREFRKRKFRAQIVGKGTLRFDGKDYDTPSQAAGAARATIIGMKNGKLPPTNGWSFWQYRGPDGKLTPLDVFRQKALSKQSGKEPAKLG